MPQNSRSSLGKLPSIACRMLAASVFLVSVLAYAALIFAAPGVNYEEDNQMAIVPKVAIPREDNEVVAVDALTGRLLWRYKPWRLSNAHFAMYRPGLVVNGELFLDPNTGKPIKPFELESTECLARSVLPPYLLHSTKIRLDNGWELSGYDLGNSETLQFVETVEGKPVWEIRADGYPFEVRSWKNLVFYTFFYFTDKAVVFAHEAGAAKPSWTVDVNQIVEGGDKLRMGLFLQVVGDALFVQARGHIFVLEPKTGKVLCHLDLTKDLGLRFDPYFYGGRFGRAVFTESQNLLVISFEKRVVALDRGSVKYLWQIQPDTFPERPFPMIYDGRVFLSSGDKQHIYQVTPGRQAQEGEPQQTFRELDWHDVPLLAEKLPPLLETILTGDFEKSLQLVDAGADVNAKTQLGGVTPLHALVRRHPDHQQLSLFKRLLKAGADIDAGIQTGRTPLMDAIPGNEELAFELIRAGAKVTYRNGIASPLHAYGALRYPAIARALITAGADVNVQDAQGRTPLHHTAYLQEDSMETYQVITMLVEAGGDLSINAGDGRDPIEFARRRRKPKIADFMESLKKEAKPKPSNRPAQPAPSRAAADSPDPAHVP